MSAAAKGTEPDELADIRASARNQSEDGTLPSPVKPGKKKDAAISIKASWTGRDPTPAQPPIEPKDSKPEDVNPWKKRTEWNLTGILVYFLYLVAFVFYFYVRIRYTLGGGIFWYSITVLVLEFLNATSMVFYGLTLCRRRASPRGVLPEPPVMQYNVRVLIPCYTESLAIVKETMTAAMRALLPDSCQRTIYLLDDGKDKDKEAWVASLQRDNVVYYNRRVRQKGETNGKAANLNNYLAMLYPPGQPIDDRELVCVFDADMVCVPEFFLRLLAELRDPQVALVLSPQKFHNFDPGCDIFNHSNDMFWHYTLRGLDGWENISCTGTNFIVRAKAGQQAGWFPTYTLGEDMAFSLELQKAGWKGAYVCEYLAIGEAPDTVRNIFMQKSRWCKGGMQIFVSKHNAIFARNVNIIQKILWNIGGWSYVTSALSSPVFLLIPLIGVWGGYFPIDLNKWFAFAFTFYLVSMTAVIYYSVSLRHARSVWFSAVASNLFWYAYSKAVVNILFSTLGFRKIAFKTTEKSTMAAVKDEANRGKKKGETSVVKRWWTLFQDVWVLAVVFLLSLSALVAAIVRMAYESNIHSIKTLSLVISAGWAVYNMIPCYLLLHFFFVGTRGLRTACAISSALSSAAIVTILVFLWVTLPPVYDYSQAMQLSFRFYDAQKSGVLPANNPIPWRGDSALTDATAGGISLAGGFFDDGGALKSTFPLAATMSTLAWGLLTFPQGYKSSKQGEEALDKLRWGADYLLKAHVSDNELIAQVGSYTADMAYYGRPEKMQAANVSRPVYSITPDRPGADLAAAASAALTATALVFERPDPTYAQSLLSHALSLYGFAKQHEGRYSDSLSDLNPAYRSSGFLDDLAWAAAWLFTSTGNAMYLQEAEAFYSRQTLQEAGAVPEPMVWNWDNQMPAVTLLLAQAQGFSATSDYNKRVVAHLDAWIKGKGGITYTPERIAWASSAGPLRNAANTALLSAIYSKRSGVSHQYQCWTEAQARFLLGDAGHSYVVGFGSNPPRRPYHEAASCPGGLDDECTVANAYMLAGPNPNIVAGALINGPMAPNAWFVDDRTSPAARVAIDYNAGFTGMCAAILEYRHRGSSYSHCTQGLGFITYFKTRTYYNF